MDSSDRRQKTRAAARVSPGETVPAESHQVRLQRLPPGSWKMRLFAGGKHPRITDSRLYHGWLCDEILAATVRDVVSGGNDLSTLSVSPPPVADAPVNFTGREFIRASSQYARSAVSVASDVAPLEQFSFVGVIRLRSTFAADGAALALSNGSGAALQIHVDASRRIQLKYHTAAFALVTVDFDKYTLELERDYAVEITRTVSGGVMTARLYFEGALAQTVTSASLPLTSLTAPYWWMGRDNAGVDYFDGVISTAFIYTGADTDEEAEDRLADVAGKSYLTTPVFKVEVRDANGVWRDLTALRNVDWVKGLEIKQHVDQHVHDATLTALRSYGDMFLSRYNDNILNRPPIGDLSSTYAGAGGELLALVVPVRVSVDQQPLDAQSCLNDGATWNEVFSGVIDTTSWGGDDNNISIPMRDNRGGPAMDCFIPVNTVRSVDVGEPVQDTMAGLLSDSQGDSPSGNYADNWGLPDTGFFSTAGFWDLTTPVDPGWNITQYQQQPMPVMEALNRLAEQIGMVVTSRWNALAGEFRLTFWQPDRAGSHASCVMDDSEVISLNELEVAAADVRNEVWVTFTPNADVTHPMTVPTINSGTGTVAPGEFYYGVPGTYAPAQTTDGQEANRVVYRVRSDQLHSSEQGYDSATKYHRRRMLVAEASSSNIDRPEEAVDFAVAMLRDLQEPLMSQSFKTRLWAEVELGDIVKVRANNHWYTADQSLGVVGFTHTFSPTEITTSWQLRGRPSAGTRRHLLKEVRPGVAPLMTADPSAPDSIVGQTTRQRRQTQATLLTVDPTYQRTPTNPASVRNGNFQARSFGERPPDGWTQKSGTWNTDAIYDFSTAETGMASVKLVSNSAELEGDAVLLRPDFDLCIDRRAKTDVPGTATLRVDVYWFDKDMAPCGTPSTTGSAWGFTGTGFQTQREVYRSPAGAVFAKFRPVKGGASGNVWCQSIVSHVVRSGFRVFRLTDQNLTDSSANNKIAFASATTRITEGAFNDGSDYSTVNFEYTTPFRGWFRFAAQVELDAGGGRPVEGYIQLRVDSTNGTDGVRVGESPALTEHALKTSLVLQVESGWVWLEAGKKVAVWAYPNDVGGAAPIAVGGYQSTWFSGGALSRE